MNITNFKFKYNNMDNLLNKLPQLIENRDNNHLLEPVIYLTAWGKWCIAYREFMGYDTSKPHKEFSVVIEPNNEPVRIEDTIGSIINEYVGNAPTFNDAIDMIIDYAYKNYNLK